MSYNRYQQNASPWASGAPPTHMYGGPPGPHPGPPPQHNMYSQPSYGPGPASPWNNNPAMRQSSWGGPAPVASSMSMQQRPMRGPNYMSGPTGKRGGYGGWHDNGPPKKRPQMGGRGSGGGGNWQGRRDDRGNQRFQNRNVYSRDNRRPNNREVSRSKANDTQLERRQQHDQAQKNAESLDKKEYPVQEVTTKTEEGKDDKTAVQLDPAQERYVKTVFGYVCNICNVFLRDKTAKADHCQSEEHLNLFNASEEERKEKEKETEKQDDSEKKDDTEETKGDENEADESLANGSEEKMVQDNEGDANEKSEVESADLKDSSEIKSDEKGAAFGEVDNAQLVDSEKSGTDPLPDPPNTSAVTPKSNPQSNTNNYQKSSDFIPNRGRGGFPRGRGGHGRGNVPRGRGRNRGRGRK